MPAPLAILRPYVSQYAGEIFVFGILVALGLAWVWGRYGPVIKEIAEIKGSINELRKDLTGRIDHLYTVFSSATAPGSPLHLTDLGKRLAEDIKAGDILAAHRQSWEQELKAVSPAEASELEAVALDIVKYRPNLTADELKRVRDSAAGANLTFENVMTILAVMMRDDVLPQTSSN